MILAIDAKAKLFRDGFGFVNSEAYKDLRGYLEHLDKRRGHKNTSRGHIEAWKMRKLDRIAGRQ